MGLFNNGLTLTEDLSMKTVPEIKKMLRKAEEQYREATVRLQTERDEFVYFKASERRAAAKVKIELLKDILNIKEDK